MLTTLLMITVSDLIAIRIQKQQNLKGVEDITSLDWKFRQLQDLDGIQICKNLSTLSLKQNAIINLSPLDILNKLQVLDISENQISELVALRFCISLKHLNVSRNCIADPKELTWLTFLPKFGSLIISENPVVNNENFRKTALIKLYDQLQYIQFISTKNDKQLLWEVDLETAQEKVILMFQKQVRKDKLNVDGRVLNNIKDMRYLCNLKANTLGIHGHDSEAEIIRIDVILNTFKDIDINNYKHISFPPPQQISGYLVVKLVLNHCGLTVLPNLEGFVRLIHLDLSYNELSNLLGLHWCSNLEELYCYASNLQSLEGIQNNRKLTYLDVYESNVSDLSPFLNFVNIKTLHLGKCKIKNITTLRGCNALISLYLYDNPFCDSEQLEVIANKQNLTEVDVNECLIPEEDKYLMYINEVTKHNRELAESKSEDNKGKKKVKQLKAVSPFVRRGLHESKKQNLNKQDSLNGVLGQLKIKHDEVCDRIHNWLILEWIWLMDEIEYGLFWQ